MIGPLILWLWQKPTVICVFEFSRSSTDDYIICWDCKALYWKDCGRTANAQKVEKCGIFEADWSTLNRKSQF